MNCQQLDNVLVAYLDGEVEPSEKAKIQQHLEHCASCQEEVQALLATRARVATQLAASGGRARISPETEDGILAQLAGQGERSKMNDLRGWWVGIHNVLSGPISLVRHTAWVGLLVLLGVGLIFAFRGIQERWERGDAETADLPDGMKEALVPGDLPDPLDQPPPAVTSLPDRILCPDTPRPAIVTASRQEGTTRLQVVGSDGEANCEIELAVPPVEPSDGGVQSAGGSLFYHNQGGHGEFSMIRQISPEGADLPLDFTRVTNSIGRLFTFKVAQDGSRVAWGAAVKEGTAENPVYYTYLWAAKLDGSGFVNLVKHPMVQAPFPSITPLHFDLAGGTLTYAVQLEPGGGGWLTQYGRYDLLYQVPLTGGEARLVFDCRERELPYNCIGDISPDGTLFAYINAQEQSLYLHRTDGTLVKKITPPPSDYLGAARFSPTGTLSFVTTRLTTSEAGLTIPESGILYAVEPPYTDDPRPLLEGPGIIGIVRWLDESHVVYDSLDSTGSRSMVLASIDNGKQQKTAYPLAVLRGHPETVGSSSDPRTSSDESPANEDMNATPTPQAQMVQVDQAITSPDGRCTAIVDASTGRLDLQNQEGKSVAVFPDGSAVQKVDWSPNGRRLAVVRTNIRPAKAGEPLRATEPIALWIVGVGDECGIFRGAPWHVFQSSSEAADDGSYAPEQIRFGSWSPDERYLLFWVAPLAASVAADGAQAKILDLEQVPRLTLETQDLLTLETPSLLNELYHTWSPDGSTLAITSGAGRSAQSNKQLDLVHLRSGIVTTVIDQKSQIPGIVAWSPNGEWIAYAAVPAENLAPGDRCCPMTFENPAIAARRIYLLDPDTGEHHRLNEIDAYQDLPVWSKDGKTLFYVQRQPEDRTIVLMEADPETGQAQPIEASRQQAPDDTRVGYYGQSNWTALLAHVIDRIEPLETIPVEAGVPANGFRGTPPPRPIPPPPPTHDAPLPPPTPGPIPTATLHTP